MNNQELTLTLQIQSLKLQLNRYQAALAALTGNAFQNDTQEYAQDTAYILPRSINDRTIIINHALETAAPARIIATTEYSHFIRTESTEKRDALRHYLESQYSIRCFNIDSTTIRASLNRDYNQADTITEQR